AGRMSTGPAGPRASLVAARPAGRRASSFALAHDFLRALAAVLLAGGRPGRRTDGPGALGAVGPVRADSPVIEALPSLRAAIRRIASSRRVMIPLHVGAPGVQLLIDVDIVVAVDVDIHVVVVPVKVAPQRIDDRDARAECQPG